MAVTEAQTAIGRLGGLGSDFPKPDRLIRMFLRREAEFSSRIEQTHASVRTLVLFDLIEEVAERSSGAREVENNYRLLLYTLDVSQSRPLTVSLLKQMHQLLFQHVERPPRIVGSFRNLQNWIGNSDDIAEARYVPPPPLHVVGCLRDLIEFMVRPPPLPLLVRTALIHYQFEAIHPFDDGNGRIGRALVLWQLVADRVIDLPLLNPSAQLEARRRQYYDLMLDVTLRGEWNAWIEYFCRCVTAECARSIDILRELTQLRVRYQEAVRQARMSALLAKLIDYLFGEPAITIKAAAETLDLTPQSAQRAIETLVRLKILTEVTGQQRNRVYLAEDIVTLFSRTPTKATHAAR